MQEGDRAVGDRASQEEGAESGVQPALHPRPFPNQAPVHRTWRRVVLKLSGEAFSGDEPLGISPDVVVHIAEQIVAALRRRFARLDETVKLLHKTGTVFRRPGSDSIDKLTQAITSEFSRLKAAGDDLIISPKEISPCQRDPLWFWAPTWLSACVSYAVIGREQLKEHCPGDLRFTRQERINRFETIIQRSHGVWVPATEDSGETLPRPIAHFAAGIKA